MGSAMWMTIRQFGSLDEAVKHLREEEGCLIYASDLNPTAKDVRDLTWDVDFDDGDAAPLEDSSTSAAAGGHSEGHYTHFIDDDEERGEGYDPTDGIDGARVQQRPICIVMGNEDRGISPEMRELADETFYLPMCGFAESFNLSVATAITLAYMSAVSDRGEGKDIVKGPLRPGDMDPHELQCLKLKGVLNSVAQRRVAKVLLKKEGIELPSSLYN